MPSLSSAAGDDPVVQQLIATQRAEPRRRCGRGGEPSVLPAAAPGTSGGLASISAVGQHADDRSLHVGRSLLP